MNKTSAESRASGAHASDGNANRAAAQPPQRGNNPDRDMNSDGKKKKKSGSKTLWVTIFRCFHCGKHGHNLRRCSQCAQAYYCDADCQRKHWRKHKPVCRAAVAALARGRRGSGWRGPCARRARTRWRARRRTPCA